MCIAVKTKLTNTALIEASTFTLYYASFTIAEPTFPRFPLAIKCKLIRLGLSSQLALSEHY